MAAAGDFLTNRQIELRDNSFRIQLALTPARVTNQVSEEGRREMGAGRYSGLRLACSFTAPSAAILGA